MHMKETANILDVTGVNGEPLVQIKPDGMIWVKKDITKEELRESVISVLRVIPIEVTPDESWYRLLMSVLYGLQLNTRFSPGQLN